MMPLNDDRRRWFATGCIAIFMLPFFAAGVFSIGEGLRGLRRGLPSALAITLVGVLFAVLSVTFAMMAFLGIRSAATAARRAREFPSQPWLWREDWAERRILETRRRPAGFLWVFAITWCAISVPMSAGFFRLSAMRPYLLFPVVFLPLLGFILLCSAAFVSLRAMKFGRSICSIDRVPIAPGESVHGEIAYRGTDVPENGYRMALSCIHRVISGGGRNRQVTEDVLWTTEWRVAGALAMPSPVGMRVPFDVTIPPDAQSSDLRYASSMILWRIDISAELPGIDYTSMFELPVFETAAGHDERAIAAYQISHRADVVQRELSDVESRPLAGGGIELRIPPVRDLSAILSPMIFCAIWFSIVVLMLKMGAPRFFSAVFAAFGVFIVLFVLDMIFGQSIVSAGVHGIEARREWLGAGMTSRLDAQQIDAIAVKPGSRSGARSYFDVEARLHDGKARTVARYLHSYEDADALAAKLWTAMGRK